jgi:hypothetical protein
MHASLRTVRMKYFGDRERDFLAGERSGDEERSPSFEKPVPCRVRDVIKVRGAGFEPANACANRP